MNKHDHLTHNHTNNSLHHNPYHMHHTGSGGPVVTSTSTSSSANKLVMFNQQQHLNGNGYYHQQSYHSQQQQQHQQQYYNDYQQQQQQLDQQNQNKYSQIPWVELEIKGFVKNISPKLWQWTHLKYLSLNDNHLMRLPPVIANLCNLQYLDVSNNKIRTLPAEIGDMTSLKELYLNNNLIRVLPYELGKLFKLQHLGLKQNPLQPEINQIYSEPNGTQKLLIYLLDQLTITCPPPDRRPWIPLAQPQDTRNTCIFTIMCYNVLCDKYATRQYYGYCPAWALTWDYRKKAILEDIKTFNADVITLQELETEQFYSFFLTELRQYDYDGIFSPKSRAKTMSEAEKKHVDGCAIFFKTSRFSLVKDYLVEFNQIAMATAEGSEDMLNRVMTKDNIGLAALLETKQEDPFNNTNNGTQSNVNNKQLVLIFTAHIHWDPEYCDVKLIQTLMLTNEVKKIIEESCREFRPNIQPVDSQSIPVVICADLNSLPESGVIEYLRSGKISANHIDFKDLGYDLCLQKINENKNSNELCHNLKLECAYDKDILPFTNYTYDFRGVIDYIFYSRNSMRTLGLLGQLDPEWLKQNKIVGFPHPHVPSDHLPLIVELELFIQPQFTNRTNQQSGSTTQGVTSATSLGQMIPVNRK